MNISSGKSKSPQGAQEKVTIILLTRDFCATVWTRAQKGARFRVTMLTEAINRLLTGDLGTGKAMLRDYVNATLTFEGLAKASGKPSKSLQRMLGARGNPMACHSCQSTVSSNISENYALTLMILMILMPSTPGILSFHNRWYPLVVQSATPIRLPDGRKNLSAISPLS